MVRKGLCSVIVPLYNKREFIEKCIDSVLGQTYPHWELIVVNDGSTDRGDVKSRVKLATWLCAKNITITNRGIAGARNAGVMNSTGEFILPLDADDLIDPTYLEKTVPLMTAGVGVVSTDMQRFGTQNELLPARIQTYEEERAYNYIPVCSLIRREAFLECGGYTPRVPGYEDWALWTDILRRGWKHTVVHEPLFHYRTGCNTANNEADKHREEFTKLIHEWNPIS